MSASYIEEYREAAAARGAKLEKSLPGDPVLKRLLRAGDEVPLAELKAWIQDFSSEYGEDVAVIDTDDASEVRGLAQKRPRLILNLEGLTHIRHLNTLLNTANEVLEDGGLLWCHSRTSGLKRVIIQNAHPGLWGRIIYALHFAWHRIMARIKLTRWFYMWVTKGKNRTYTRVELLGRMYRAGFEVVDERFLHGEFIILGRKVNAPIWDDDPSNGFIIKLNRVGYHGKPVGVYKFRTMHPYSEYLQPYIYENEGLGRLGKFAHDYRVNWLGNRIRGTWIDELPMLFNLLKGQIKMVGVRPLSQQYLSLYTPEMQTLHISVKPGLIPPFYYEEKTPETIEEVQESERRYIEAYRKHPLRTDWRYFWGILGNILFKHKRSR